MAGCNSEDSEENNGSTNTNGKIEVEVSMIWNQAPHSAFTDLIHFNNAFYCSFREGSSHLGPGGSVRVIKSVNGIDWETAAFFEIKPSGSLSTDLRDPKLSVTPDNRIMLLIDVEYYNNGNRVNFRPYISYSDTFGQNFSSLAQCPIYDPELSSVKSYWIWRVSWDKNGKGYGVDYLTPLTLFKTDDGKTYQSAGKINVDGSPNETTIRFDQNGKMYTLIRRESGDQMGVLATSNAPYNEWTFNKLTERLGGPNFIFLNDETLCIGTRMHPALTTGLIVTDLTGKTKKRVVLPSSGDCSYPGMLIHDGKLWVSYYSSHQGRTSIYLAKVPVAELMK